MTRDNPFEDSIFNPDSLLQSGESVSLYPKELDLIKDHILSSNQSTNHKGKILMVSSPDSGQGKTHLIAEALESKSTISTSVQINLSEDSKLNYSFILQQIIFFLSHESSKGSLSPLSLMARTLFADLICNLVTDGIVPVENKSTAINGLRKHYDKMLNFRDRSSLIAEWFKQNISALFPHLVTALMNKTGLSNRSCEFWIEILYGCELDGPEIIINEINSLNDHDAQTRIEEFNKSISHERPLTLIFDHLDLLYKNTEQSLKLTQLLTSLTRQGVLPLVILAINDDLWDSTFTNAIPSAVRDRVNEINVRLNGISIHSAQELIRHRIERAGSEPHTADNFINRIDLEQLYQSTSKKVLPSPRQILRMASTEWLKGRNDKVFLNKPSTLKGQKITHHSAPTETLQRIQKMMRSVNQRTASSSNQSAETTKETIVNSPWKDPEKNAPSSVKDFANQRNELYSSGQSLFDTEAIRYTLEMAGRRSPIIEYREFDVHGDSSASSWLSPEMEIIFGFEPAERIPYWRALVDQAENSPMQSSKVIAFKSPEEKNFQLDELNGSARKNLDVLELNRGDLASIAASRAIINASDSEEETFSQIAPELDFLWRRITRPVRNIS